MKAFVVVAFLVASVASQRMDILQQLNKERSLFKADRPLTVEDLLLKEKLGGHFLTTKTNMMEQEYPMTSTWGRQTVSVLSLEELVQTELFREYYNIPLFRQFWEQYPIVFHKYVQSVLFQQFWTIPQFQQYFRNPVFFYKYIVPQVQVIAQSVEQYKNVDLFNTNKYESIVDRMTNKFTYPYGIQHQYNKEWAVPMTQTYGVEDLSYPTNSVNYKFLLDKIYKHLMMTKYGKVQGIETLTDVKDLKNGRIQETVFGKMVDPITGEEKVTRGDLKIVDEKIVPVQTLDFPVEKRMNRIVESEMMKDALLKRIYLNKIFGKKFMTPEYETVYGKKFVPEYETIFGGKKFTPELEKYETVFGGKKFVPELEKFESLFGENKKFLTPESEYETVFGNKIMTPEIYERMMMKKNFYNTYEPEMSQYGSVLPTEERYMNTNKWMSPIVARMYGLNKNVNKINNFLPYGQQYNKIDLINKFNTEKMIEEIQKEKLINQFENEKMINNQFLTKEHQKIFNTINLEKTMEVPTMETEKYNHIPLTFTKPTLGSGINEFQKEIKEINY